MNPEIETEENAIRCIRYSINVLIAEEAKHKARLEELRGRGGA